MLNLILSPFALLLGWFYSITGNYGLAIVLFCVIFKLLLFPISIKGRKAMLDMSRLSEKQKELQQKYGRDRTRYSQELNDLYTRENVKPSGGCLWSFIPLPLLFALYGIVSQPFTHLMKLNKEQVLSLTNFILGEGTKGASQLSMAQTVYQNFDSVRASLPEIASKIESAGGPINFDFFGLNLSSTPNIFFFKQPDAFQWATIGLIMIPIVSAIFSLLSMKVNTHINQKVLGVGGQNDAMNRQMMIMQPILSLWIGFTLPAALGFYWITNSVLAVVQEYASIGILKKHLRVTREAAAKRAIEDKDKVKEQKKLAAEKKKLAAEEARRIKLERSVSTAGISESRVGMRAYAKGRTFDDDRYEVTPYHDPDDILKEQQAARAAAPAAPAAGKKGKKKKGVDEELPKGMRLNESASEQPTPPESAPASDETTEN